MASSYVDISAVINVIGCVYMHPELMGMEDKYTFSSDDFYDSFHKTIFGVIYNLYKLGAKEITLNSIEDYLSNRPKLKAIYDNQKGAEFITRAIQSVSLSTFDYYYNRLKKMTLFRSYEKQLGMDLKWLYDPDNILDSKKKQEQEEFLDNSSLADLIHLIDDKIDSIKIKMINEGLEEGKQAGTGIQELIENLKNIPELGYPLYGPYINTVTRGARLGKFYLRSASTGIGKALPNSTKIPTTEGWKKVGEVKVGDKLFDRVGQPTTVLKVFPQGQRNIWEILFQDGRVAKCSPDHLWSYYLPGEKELTTKTLREIYESGDYLSYGFPQSKAVQYETKQYSIDPYAFGYEVLNKFDTLKDNLDDYLFGDVEQRYDLLNGILDRNGKIQWRGTTILSIDNIELREKIVELIRSLGISVTIDDNTLHLLNNDKLFKAKVKKRILLNNPMKGINEYNSIIKITPTKEKEEMTCFLVDNEEHLFLMNDFIVTHNTRSMIADAAYIGCGQMWDINTGKWICTGAPQPTLYIATEQQLDEVQTMICSFVAGVNEEHILYGSYEEGEWGRIVKASQIITQGKLYVVVLPDFSLQDVEDTIKREIREHKIKYCFFDYLHSSLKILEEVATRTAGMKLREDNVLFMLSARLKDICIQYGIFIMSATQLNGGYTEATVYDQNLLRGSKAIAD